MKGLARRGSVSGRPPPSSGQAAFFSDSANISTEAFAVKVDTKRLPVFLFSGLLNDCKGHKTHRFETGDTNQLRKTGNREVDVCQP